MNKKAVIIFAILAAILVGCGAKAASPMLAGDYEQPLMDERGYGGGAPNESIYDPSSPPMATAAPSGLAYTESGGGPAPAPQNAAGERMVIMNADVTVVVADPQAKADAIVRMAQQMGGYVVSMQMYQTELYNGVRVPAGYISIRIPHARLEAALDQIKADAVEVRNEARTSQDVTAQYVDLESQLRNLEQAESDLLEIMKQATENPGNDSTTKTQDVLNVHNHIVSIRGQIEQIKGQMNYYKDVTDTSLVNVNLIAEETVQPIQIGPWSPKGAWNQAIQDLVEFWHDFVDALIRFFVLILPVLVLTVGPFALIAWAVVAGVRRRKAKKAKAG
jgi:hypothetical protein